MMDIDKGLRYLKRKDPTIAKLIRAYEKPVFTHKNKAFDSLIQSIIYQQLAGAAAGTIHKRFLSLYDGKPTPLLVLRTDVRTLRKCGLSRQKISYLKDLSKHVKNGTLEIDRLHMLSDEKVIEELVAVKGIGRWTAEMFLIFDLGRLDVFAVDDLGLRNAVVKLYRLREPITKEKLNRIADRWRPYRSIASWYLWKWKDGDGQEGW